MDIWSLGGTVVTYVWVLLNFHNNFTNPSGNWLTSTRCMFYMEMYRTKETVPSLDHFS